MTNEELLGKWNNLTSYVNGYKRIDAEHPLDWYIGFENTSQKSLLLVSNFEPKGTHSSKSVDVSVRQRGDGKWALSFRLVRGEQEEVFIRLCCDLIEASRHKGNDKDGLQFVIKRYGQWAKLMAAQHTGLLSESEKKGLIGELLFLQEIIFKGLSIEEAVSGWMGPEGADQDFIYSDKWYEVKAIRIGSNAVSISSLEQFNAPLPGELVLYFIDKTTSNDPNCFTLKRKIEDVRHSLQSNQLAYEIFNEKVLKYGYIDLPEYEWEFYKLGGNRKFLINEDFPRLTCENVPGQIMAVKYQLSIQAIEPWKIV